MSPRCASWVSRGRRWPKDCCAGSRTPSGPSSSSTTTARRKSIPSPSTRTQTAKPGSAGKAGINQRIRVVEIGTDDPKRTVAAGVEGEVIASMDSEEAFAGYWQRPDADARALKRGWYFTGDVGYCDGDGDLFVTGRVDDMVITGGENVLPAEIESVLSVHPAVAEAAVAGPGGRALGAEGRGLRGARRSGGRRDAGRALSRVDTGRLQAAPRSTFSSALSRSRPWARCCAAS